MRTFSKHNVLEMVYCYIVTMTLLSGTIGCIDKALEKTTLSSEKVPQIDKVRLTDLNGQTIDLKEFRGKTVFLNIWATWCRPCIREKPSIQDAQSKLQDENIIFLIASAESAEEIKEFINNNDYNLNYVRIENSEEMNVQALPTTFIFNRNGDLVFSEAGSRKWNKKKNIDLIRKIAKENE